MTRVVFVGDAPSKTNVSDNIAFVGAKCFPTLVEWIKEINPDYYVCLNSNVFFDLEDAILLYKDGFKVVALGAKASERLSLNDVKHFVLPHPSGLNRQLNDKTLITTALRMCKNYVNSNSSN